MARALRVIGRKRLDRALRLLPLKVQKKVLRTAVTKATRLARKEVKKQAPKTKHNSLRKPNIQVRTIKKVGWVGKAGYKKGSRGIHTAHLVSLGTAERVRKDGRKTGRVTGSKYMQDARRSAVPKMKRKIKSEVERGVIKAARAVRGY